MSATNKETAAIGGLTAAISNSMVGLLHRYTGRGPTRARTTIGENIVVCVMGATLTKGELSLVGDGKAEVVLHSRRAFQDTIQAETISAVQELSGRKVVAFMSNNHIDPDLAVEVFVLEPAGSDLLGDERVDGHDPRRDGDHHVDGYGPRRDGDHHVDGHGPRLDGGPGLDRKLPLA
ncbi:MAG: Na-translocating system protein MpsC family protein [Solirubrobacteraceae bacterium]